MGGIVGIYVAAAGEMPGEAGLGEQGAVTGNPKLHSCPAAKGPLKVIQVQGLVFFR